MGHSHPDKFLAGPASSLSCLLLLLLLLLLPFCRSQREPDVPLAECPMLLANLEAELAHPRRPVPRELSAYQRHPDHCWSRAEWKCFKTRAQEQGSSYVSGPVLERALRHYRRAWQVCHESESSEEVLEKLLSGAHTVCRYVLWVTPMDGVGNRLINLVSTFVFALLTNRILLIDTGYETSIADMLCEPFPEEPSWKVAGLRKLYDYRLASQYNLDYFNCSLLDEATPNVVSLSTLQYSKDFSRLGCAGFLAWANAASAIHMSGNQYFLPRLYTLPGLGNRMPDLFPDGNPMATITSILIKPGNTVWEWASRRLLHSGGASRSAGVQLRASTAPNNKLKLEYAAKCLARFWPDARSKGHVEGAKVFIASMALEAPAVLSSSLEHVGVTGADIEMLTRDNHQASSAKDHNERVLSELVVLALASDVLLTSPVSTFGYVTAAFSPAPSFFIDSHCTQGEDSCFHAPSAPIQCCSSGITSASHLDSPYIVKCNDNGGVTVGQTPTKG